MKKNRFNQDWKIQELLDRGTNSYESKEFLGLHEDTELYRELFDSLEDEPELYLDTNFSKNIIEISYRKKRMKDTLWKISLYAVVSFFLISVSIVAVLAIEPDMFWNAIDNLKISIAYLLLGIGIFTIIQILDKVLIRNRLSRPEV